MRILVECRSVTPGTSCGIENFVYSLLRGIAAAHPEDELLVNVPPGTVEAWRAQLPDARITLVEDRAQGRWLRLRARVAPLRWGAGAARRIHPRLTSWLEGPRPAWVRRWSRRADVVLYPFQRDRLLHRLPAVFVMHDFFDFDLPGAPRRLVRDERYSIRRARVVTASWPGPFRSLLRGFPRRSGDAAMVPFVFDPTPAHPAPADPAARTLVYAASTGAHKNHETLIRALGVLRRAGAAPVRVMCPGAQQPERMALLQALARAEGVDGWIRFLGFVERERVLALYREASGVVAPTRYEAFSGAVLEGLQHGLPVACSRIPANEAGAEMLGATVRFFDPGDPADAAAAILELLERPAQYREGALRARAALLDITPERTALQYRELLAWAAGLGPRPEWFPARPLARAAADPASAALDPDSDPGAARRSGARAASHEFAG